MLRSYLPAIGVAALNLIGCASRDTVLSTAKEPLQFGPPGSISLPANSGYAEKRGFADYTGDGLTDMVEIKDEAIFGQKWTAKIFGGTQAKDGLLHFGNSHKVDIPLQADWFTNQTKLDAGDVNGDSAADVIMTQYTQGFLEDTFHIAIGMNNGNGTQFAYGAESYIKGESLGLWIHQILRLVVKDYGTEHLDQYFKMDWADMNGDKKDDLCVFWMDRHDLHVKVAYSTTPPNERTNITFGEQRETVIPKFLYSRDMTDVDTEDFTGDGFADIVSYYSYLGDRVDISMAENAGKTGALAFALHQDFRGREKEVATVGFEKRDSFDINGDGYADYVHAGRIDGNPSLTYLLTVPNPAQETRPK